MKNWILYGGIILAVILVFSSGYILRPSTSGSTSSTKSSIKPPSNTLTISQKEEICNDMKAWLGFCYDQNIDSQTCAEQMNEKVMRLYKISSNQLKEVYDYCK